MKLIYTKDPNNRTYKMIQNISKNLSRLNDHSKANWSNRDLTKVCFLNLILCYFTIFDLPLNAKFIIEIAISTFKRES